MPGEQQYGDTLTLRAPQAAALDGKVVAKWVFGGRPLLVAVAVDADSAKGLRDVDHVGVAKKRKLEATGDDVRWLSLADEGYIQRGDAAAAGVPEEDMKKRERARQDQKTKLKHPLFYVNPTRLSPGSNNLRRGISPSSAQISSRFTVRCATHLFETSR